MKKRNYIIFAAVVVVLAMAFALLYIDFTKKKEEGGEGRDIDYTTEYEIQENVKEKIEPVTGVAFFAHFSEREGGQGLADKIEEIRLLLDYEPGQKLTVEDVEEMVGKRIDGLFGDCSLRMVGQVKTNLKHNGYCIKTQRKTGLAPKITLAVTTDALTKRAEESMPSVEKSEFDGVRARIVYHHSRQTFKNETENGQTDRYTYECVLEYNKLYYYVQMDYSGYDINLKVIETNKEKTSREFAEFLRSLIGILKKDS